MASFRQDMPPSGGYAPIAYARVPHKRFWTGWTMLAALIGTSTLSIYRGLKWKLYMRKLEVEKFDTLLALQPFVHAESDRAFLKHLRHIREEERNLMKNHPGWEIGTLYGEPIYKTIPKTELLEVDLSEYYGHRPPHELFYDHQWPECWN